MRVLFAAFALSVLSFAAGIAGDLSMAAPPAPSVIVHLPPPIAANAVRAHPLAPFAPMRALPAIAHVRANVRADVRADVRAVHRTHHVQLEQIVARAKPEPIQAVGLAKVDPDRAPKHDGPETAQI